MDISSWTGLPIEAILLLIVGYYVLEIVKTIFKRGDDDDKDDKVVKAPAE